MRDPHEPEVNQAATLTNPMNVASGLLPINLASLCEWPYSRLIGSASALYWTMRVFLGMSLVSIRGLRGGG